MTTALREAISPQDRYYADSRAIFRQLDSLERDALRRILARVDELRKDVTDQLLALPTTMNPDGSETWQAWQLRAYQHELEAAAARWGDRVRADLAADLQSAADLGKAQMPALSALAQAEGVPAALVSFGTGALLDTQIAVAVLHSADLIKGVQQSVITTTNRAIQQVVFGGGTRADAIRDIRAALATQPSRQDKKLGSLTNQAIRIEQTELIRSYGLATSYSLENAAEELPGLQSEWVAILDSRVDPICASLGGKRVPVGKPFPDGYYAPPAHPRCRCRLAAWKPGWPDDPFPLGTPHRAADQ